MWTIGIMPPIGVKLSCMQLTEPFDVPVVVAAHSPHDAGPKRTSLPSRLPPTSCADEPWSTPIAVSSGLPELSATIANSDITSQMPAITASRTRACFLEPTRTPYVTTRAIGMTTIAHVSTKFVNGLGFSNGWAELVLKNPPPFVPSCLMATWLATGPPGIACVDTSAATAGSSGVAAVEPVRFCTTPPASSSDGDDERQRQQDAQRRAHEVDPEVADACAGRGG